MLTAITLLAALGLDNTAVGGSIVGPWRPWLRLALGLALAALVLAAGGALAGRLLRLWLHGWAQLMGAVVMFSLAVDALREATSDRPRLSPDDLAEAGNLWRWAISGLGGNLDELGVGFAFGGSLHAFGLRAWGLACLLETVAALGTGFLLRRWLAEGRQMAPWSAAALFLGSSVLLLAFPVQGPRVPY